MLPETEREQFFAYPARREVNMLLVKVTSLEDANHLSAARFNEVLKIQNSIS